MICPSCNKFAAYDTSAEPEFDLNIDDQGNVTGSVRIVLMSECCGDELKEATFDIDEDFSEFFEGGEFVEGCLDEDGDLKDDHEFSVESELGEITDRSETTKKKVKKDGTVVERPIPARYQKRFFGVSGTIVVTCSCGVEHRKDYSDEIQESSMDELV